MLEFHYSVQEVRMFLEVDDETVLSWIHSGELVAVNAAKTCDAKRPTWRISESEIGRFLLHRRCKNGIAKRQAKEAERLKAYLA